MSTQMTKTCIAFFIISVIKYWIFVKSALLSCDCCF